MRINQFLRKPLRWIVVGILVLVGVFGASQGHSANVSKPAPSLSVSLDAPTANAQIADRQPVDRPIAEQPDVLGPMPSPLPLAEGGTAVAIAYTPVEEVAPADPSNYGYRYLTDIDGNPASNAMIVVLHETVGSASSAINTLQTHHTNENNQVSYHSLIRRNGNIVHLVHPQMRAFGAGNSVFNGPNGPETVRTHAIFPGSVNNFAYHTSLESPSDGRGNQRRHSGYTDAQYRSLAWLVAHLPVPDDRITTHEAVDRSGSRMDPRSFDQSRFFQLLHQYDRSFLTGAASTAP